MRNMRKFAPYENFPLYGIYSPYDAIEVALVVRDHSLLQVEATVMQCHYTHAHVSVIKTKGEACQLCPKVTVIKFPVSQMFEGFLGFKTCMRKGRGGALGTSARVLRVTQCPWRPTWWL